MYISDKNLFSELHSGFFSHNAALSGICLIPSASLVSDLLHIEKGIICAYSNTLGASMEMISPQNELTVQRSSPCHGEFITQVREKEFFSPYPMVKNDFGISCREYSKVQSMNTYIIVKKKYFQFLY